MLDALTPVLAGHYPPFSAPLIDQYLAAGGIIMGKTALHELSAGGTSIGPTSNNLTSVLNPWNVIHHTGGVLLCCNAMLTENALLQDFFLSC